MNHESTFPCHPNEKGDVESVTKSKSAELLFSRKDWQALWGKNILFREG